MGGADRSGAFTAIVNSVPPADCLLCSVWRRRLCNFFSGLKNRLPGYNRLQFLFTTGGDMTSMILALMMQVATTQFLVSTKAGLVNYVQGASTVKVATTIPQGQIFATGPGGAVEILLNPGSYLRMGENTRVVFDQVDLYNIVVRILDGSMVIEANGFDKDLDRKSVV